MTDDIDAEIVDALAAAAELERVAVQTGDAEMLEEAESILAHGDYIRKFAIVDAPRFAKDVAYAMQSEREDGSTPLSTHSGSPLE